MWEVALGEDHSRICNGSLTRLLAALANLAVSILRLQRTTIFKRRMRQVCLDPNAAVALLLG